MLHADAPARTDRPAGGWRWLLHHALLRGLRPAREPHAQAPERQPLQGGTVRRLAVTGRRGQRLALWLARPAAAVAHGSLPAVVAVHGWGANASTLWPVVQPLVGAGLALALFDVSSHGDSSAEDFCSLPRFAEDLAAVLARLRAEPGIAPERIAVLGHSVGAAAVILHAARQDDVRAVVSLSAFAHPREMMERWMATYRVPWRWLGPVVLEHVQQTIGARFDAIAPLHTLPALRCPALLVHGRDDTTVPFDDALRLAGVQPRARLLAVESGHDLRAALAPHATTIVGFLSAALASAKDPSRRPSPGPWPQG